VTLPTGRRLYVAIGVAALAVVVALSAMRDDDPEASPAAAPRRGGQPRGAQQAVAVDDVRLELLKGKRAELAEAERNPFRFQARQAPARPEAPSSPPVARGPVAAAPPLPQGPPPPPPIPLRYIGLMDSPTQSVRVAILSDGRGNVFYGKEGDIIEGRYRVTRIAPDAAELAHLDGRGRQTIRLSGQ
jgi:hypothetical protein